MQELNAGRSLIYMLPASAAGPNEGLVDISLKEAESFHHFAQSFFFGGADAHFLVLAGNSISIPLRILRTASSAARFKRPSSSPLVYLMSASVARSSAMFPSVRTTASWTRR